MEILIETACGLDVHKDIAVAASRAFGNFEGVRIFV